MLSFEPEPLWKMRQRYNKALERIWIAREGMDDTPGSHREHVFDFGTGLRLIISRDIFAEEKGPEIHVSASWFNEPKNSLDEIYEEILMGFRLLDKRPGHLTLVGVSEKGVPHFVLKEVN